MKKRDKGQSPFTAMVSTVVLVGILSFSIMQVSDISRRVADEARQRERLDMVIAVSNDLVAGPGYNGTSLDWNDAPEHLGLARYETERRMVLDHVLDPEKIAFLREGGIGLIRDQYGIGNASIRIETFSGEVLLDVGNFSGDRLQIARVALLKKGEGYERVRLFFALEA